MLGDEIHKARESVEMTQESLSYAAEIGRSYVSLLENNKKSPTVDVLLRICDALGITASRLLGRGDSETKGQEKVVSLRALAAFFLHTSGYNCAES